MSESIDTSKEGVVAIVAEQYGEQLMPISLEILGAATFLAEKLKTKTVALLLGHGELEPLAQTLVQHGADSVYIANDPQLKDYRAEPYKKVITDWIQQQSSPPQVVLMGGTTTGRDFAPRLAATLETGLTADVTELDIGPYECKNSRDKSKIGSFSNCLYAIRPSFGESLKATILGPWNDPQMATIRQGVFPPNANDHQRTGEIHPITVKLEEKDHRVKIIESVRAVSSTIDLQKANVIISGGYGLGNTEGFQLVQELANCFDNVAIGASRKVVDMGWKSYQHQVGQTGKTVRPDLYIALGISGAIQHRVGMQNAKCIIAVNKDPSAPIFDFAHYGIVGDVYEIIPQMITQLCQANQQN